MERTEINSKDVIIHKDMTPESREKELKRLKEESENLKEWGRVNTTVRNDRWYFYTLF